MNSEDVIKDWWNPTDEEISSLLKLLELFDETFPDRLLSFISELEGKTIYAPVVLNILFDIREKVEPLLSKETFKRLDLYVDDYDNAVNCTDWEE